MTTVMVVAVTEPRLRTIPCPLPWNMTSTLDAATNAEYFYDYAGQDSINGYDLNGTYYYEGADMTRECGSDWKSAAVRRCAFNYWLTKAYCARWKHDATCHSTGSSWLSAAWSWVKGHATDLAQAGVACFTVGAWGAEWGSLTALPYATAAGAVGGCLAGAGADLAGADLEPPDWSNK